MKAQFVYENLDFERGKDPKTSIGVGVEKFIRDQIKRNIKYPIEPGEEKDFWASGPAYSIYDDEKDIMLAWAVDKNKPEYVQWIIDNGGNAKSKFFLEKAFLMDYFEVLKLLLKNGADPNHEILDRAYNSGAHSEGNKILQKYGRNTNESLRFERSMDPKRSLKIGRAHPAAVENRRKERWREMDKDFKEEFGDFMYNNSNLGGFYRFDQKWGESLETAIRVDYSSSWKKKNIKEWFKENHPYFKVKSLKQGLSGPGVGGAAYLYIEYIDL